MRLAPVLSANALRAAEGARLVNESPGQATPVSGAEAEAGVAAQTDRLAGLRSRAGFRSGAHGVPTPRIRWTFRMIPASPSHRPDAPFNLRGRGLPDNTDSAGNWQEIAAGRRDAAP